MTKKERFPNIYDVRRFLWRSHVIIVVLNIPEYTVHDYKFAKWIVFTHKVSFNPFLIFVNGQHEA